MERGSALDTEQRQSFNNAAQLANSYSHAHTDKSKKKSKKVKKIKVELKKNNKRLKKKSVKPKVPKKHNFILKVINFQNSLKPEINFKINFSFENYIQAFFDKIASTISQYKILKKDEERRLKLEKQERERHNRPRHKRDKAQKDEPKQSHTDKQEPCHQTGQDKQGHRMHARTRMSTPKSPAVAACDEECRSLFAM